jgi:predicted transcriptional regulator
MSATDTAILTVRLNTELKARLEVLARSTKRSKSHLAAEAIAAFVDLNLWQIGEIEAGLAELDAGEVIRQEEVEAAYEHLLQPR